MDNRKKNYGALLVVKIGLVIIVLLIIRLIVVYYNRSMYSSYKNTVYTMIKACKIYYNRTLLQGKTPEDIELKCDIQGCYSNDYKLEYLGDNPSSGTITIDKDSFVNGEVRFNSKRYQYKIINDQIEDNN